MGTVIHTTEAPEAVGAYSQAIRSGNTVFTSGQVGLDPETGDLVDRRFRAEANQALENLRTILTKAGSGPEQIVKTTVFLTNLDHYPELNELYEEFFEENLPARSVVEVASLPAGARVEIEAIATID